MSYSTLVLTNMVLTYMVLTNMVKTNIFWHVLARSLGLTFNLVIHETVKKNMSGFQGRFLSQWTVPYSAGQLPIHHKFGVLILRTRHTTNSCQSLNEASLVCPLFLLERQFRRFLHYFYLARHHKSEITDAALALLSSYPRLWIPRAAYKNYKRNL